MACCGVATHRHARGFSGDSDPRGHRSAPCSELQHWGFPWVVNSRGGSDNAIIGVTWLPLRFGPYFAWKLIKAGAGPSRVGIAVAAALGATVVFFAGPFLIDSTERLLASSHWSVLLITLAAAFIPLRGWRTLGVTLLAYAFAARIPVAVVILIAMSAHGGQGLGTILMSSRWLVGLALVQKSSCSSDWPRKLRNGSAGLSPPAVWWARSPPRSSVLANDRLPHDLQNRAYGLDRFQQSRASPSRVTRSLSRPWRASNHAAQSFFVERMEAWAGNLEMARLVK
jgi:hypothetical protein